MAVPHTLAFYVPYGTLIMFDTMEISISDVLCLSQSPLSLLRHDHQTQSLIRVDEQVRIFLPRHSYFTYIHTLIGVQCTGILTVFETPSL